MEMIVTNELGKTFTMTPNHGLFAWGMRAMKKATE